MTDDSTAQAEHNLEIIFAGKKARNANGALI
jgi:hypothetical protein